MKSKNRHLTLTPIEAERVKIWLASTLAPPIRRGRLHRLRGGFWS